MKTLFNMDDVRCLVLRCSQIESYKQSNHVAAVAE
jgi:hypothetical protein